ncbi:MAG: tryptophan--tRNA ligase [Patescibacteria group bacterium]
MTDVKSYTKKRVFSGVQPSGDLHIGNYLGAIRQFVALQDEYSCIFCVVDEHAITVPQEPEALRKKTLEIALIYLAAGIDPEKSIIFVQSHVPAHTELGWILNTMTPLGELERMTQFKDKATTQNKEIYAGLLNYPTLMAADILLYQTDRVPVGEDQLQHVELTRSIAKRFNNRFGETFVVPEALIQKDTARIMGLDDPTKKMSKSATSPANYVALLDPPDVIRKKIKSAVTDSGTGIRYDPEQKPGISNLLAIASGFSGAPIAQLEKEWSDAPYAKFKEAVAEIVITELKKFQESYNHLAQDQNAALDILQKGRDNATIIAGKTLSDVKEEMGFLA